MASSSMTSLVGTFNWGDGSTTSDPHTFTPPTTLCPIGSSHPYTSVGTYTLTVTANATYDGGGTDSATATYSIVVSASSPTYPPPPSPPPPLPAGVRIATFSAASETGAIGQFDILRQGGDLTQPLTVTYVVAGTATPLLDYNALSGTVTFAAYANTATISVTAIDDTLYDPNETVIVTLSNGPGYSVQTPGGMQTISIVENDCRLAGKVWLDSDGDGIEDLGEIGLGGIHVELYDSAMTLLDGTTTADAGTYSFTFAPTTAGYILHFISPTGYSFTTSNVSTAGYTSAISLTPGENYNTSSTGLGGVGPIMVDNPVYVEAYDYAAPQLDLAADGYSPYGHTLTPTIVTLPTHGTLTLNSGTGLYDYAASGYTGLDSFQFKLADGTHESAAVTVSILSHGEPFDSSLYSGFPLMGGALYVGNGGKPDTHTIKQGAVYDCWLVAAAAALAANATQRPDFIPGIISSSPNGTYDVTIAGVSVSVDLSVDAFEYSTANGDWLKILERAYARAAWVNAGRGNTLPYSYLNRSNMPSEGIWALTNHGVDSYSRLTSTSTLREKVNAANRDHKIMTAVTYFRPLLSIPELSPNGDNNVSHVYTIIGYDARAHASNPPYFPSGT